MDSLNALREVIERTLLKHVHPLAAPENVQTQTVFDRMHDHYLLVTVGWGKKMRVHGTLAHIDLVGEKVWIQIDGTEEGLAHQLVQAGIPPQQIVLGYRTPEIRQHTGYAIA